MFITGGSRVEESAIGYFASAVAVTAVSFFAFFVLINLVSSVCEINSYVLQVSCFLLELC